MVAAIPPFALNVAFKGNNIADGPNRSDVAGLSLAMDQTQLLLRLMASGSVRGDDKNRTVLDSLVEQGLCKRDTLEPIFRLTEKGQLKAGSLVAPLFTS